RRHADRLHGGRAGAAAHRGGRSRPPRTPPTQPRRAGEPMTSTTVFPNSTAAESRTVRIREAGPRDGFQNEPETIATADKIRLINALGRAGVKRIEVASFVRPDVIPQLSDGVEVLQGIDVPDDVQRMVLVPNSKGLDNALAHRDLFEEIALFV